MPIKLDIYSYRAQIPNPVVTSFGTIPSRSTVLLGIQDDTGITGWGEVWSNFPAVTAEYRAKLAAEMLPNALLGTPITEPKNFTDKLTQKFRVIRVQGGEPGPIDAVIAATNQALWDLRARKLNLPLRKLLNQHASNFVPAYGSGLNPNDFVEVSEIAIAGGHNALKLKVGFGQDTDRLNVEKLRSIMGLDGKLFVDANQCWDIQETKGYMPLLIDNDVRWLEEPMIATAPMESWKDIANYCSIPLAGGENIMTGENLIDAFEWLAFIQPDIGKWGGVDGCFEIGKLATKAGKTYCPHWLSGGVGLLHSAHVLAAVEGEGLLEVDVNENPLRSRLLSDFPTIDGGNFYLGDEIGIGLHDPTRPIQPFLKSHSSFYYNQTNNNRSI